MASANTDSLQYGHCFIDGPGVSTDHSLYLGFGLEGVTGADNRAQLMKDAMASFGVSP